jgi:cobalamin biosynthesis Mg chelatase CobN
MRWYNNTDEIAPKGFGSGIKTSTPNIAPSNAALGQGSQSQGSNFDLDSLTKILTTGVQVSGTVKAQRGASGKSAERQARIEACGRKGLGYFFSRTKKQAYNKCVDEANRASYSDTNQGSNMPPPPPPRSNTLLFVGIGVVVIAGIAYFVMRKK